MLNKVLYIPQIEKNQKNPPVLYIRNTLTSVSASTIVGNVKTSGDIGGISQILYPYFTVLTLIKVRPYPLIVRSEGM